MNKQATKQKDITTAKKTKSWCLFDLSSRESKILSVAFTEQALPTLHAKKVQLGSAVHTVYHQKNKFSDKQISVGSIDLMPPVPRKEEDTKLSRGDLRDPNKDRHGAASHSAKPRKRMAARIA